MNPAPPPGPYTVRLAGGAANEVPGLLRRAIDLGVRGRLTTAFREIEQALTADPTGWGDPQRRLAAARLTIYHRVYDELSVIYAVHETARVVWITAIIPVLTHPLRRDAS